MSFIAEIKRRKVIHVVVAYCATAVAVVGVVDLIKDPLEFPVNFDRGVIYLLLILFPFVPILAWVFNLNHPHPHAGDGPANIASGDSNSDSEEDVLDLRGKNVVFTGTLNMERDVLAKQAGRLGATIKSQVTGNTDFLIAGAKPGANKIKTATRHEVPIVNADTWYATVNKLSR